MALALLVSLLIGSLEASGCPPAEDMWPCTCFPDYEVWVECRSIRKPEDLVSPMEALRRSRTRVSSLAIKNSSLSYLPDNLFNNIHIETIYLKDAKFISLSEHGTPFNGLENVLVHITAQNVDFGSGLKLGQFRNLKQLRMIRFQTCRMNSTVYSLPSLPNLITLDIKYSGISSISIQGSLDLPKLAFFRMPGNEIREVKRNILPNPANNLENIDLSDNRLSSLPMGFFDNMPNLRRVDLRNNQFSRLPEEPFLDLVRFDHLDMTGNPFHCDCEMLWIARVIFRPYFQFKASCTSPEELSGKQIRSVDFESLCDPFHS